MSLGLLVPEFVEDIHDAILNPGELQGRARDKSLEGALGRVDSLLVYGMIADVFYLDAAYALAIAQEHFFNNGNVPSAEMTQIAIAVRVSVVLAFLRSREWIEERKMLNEMVREAREIERLI